MDRPKPSQSDVESLFYHLSRAHHQMLGILQREIDRLDGNEGLHPGMRHLFCLLSGEDGFTVSEMAGKLKMAKSSVTAVIKKMEAADLVRLEPDLNDLRLRRVVLTDRGRSLQPACARIDAMISEKLEAEFSPAERKQIIDLLKRLIATMKANEDE